MSSSAADYLGFQPENETEAKVEIKVRFSHLLSYLFAEKIYSDQRNTYDEKKDCRLVKIY